MQGLLLKEKNMYVCIMYIIIVNRYKEIEEMHNSKKKGQLFCIFSLNSPDRKLERRSSKAKNVVNSWVGIKLERINSMMIMISIRSIHESFSLYGDSTRMQLIFIWYI